MNTFEHSYFRFRITAGYAKTKVYTEYIKDMAVLHLLEVGVLYLFHF